LPANYIGIQDSVKIPRFARDVQPLRADLEPPSRRGSVRKLMMSYVGGHRGDLDAS
jgi:hypothetical protein